MEPDVVVMVYSMLLDHGVMWEGLFFTEDPVFGRPYTLFQEIQRALSELVLEQLWMAFPGVLEGAELDPSTTHERWGGKTFRQHLWENDDFRIQVVQRVALRVFVNN